MGNFVEMPVISNRYEYLCVNVNFYSEYKFLTTIIPIEKELSKVRTDLIKCATSLDVLRANDTLSLMEPSQLAAELSVISTRNCTTSSEYGAMESSEQSDVRFRLSTAKWFIQDHPYWTQQQAPNYKGLESTYMGMCRSKVRES